jgi:glycosyltransferase involved in cell wall biosynthesis
MTSFPSGLRVLQLGPLYGGHVRRWSDHAAAIGCTVYAAGHVRPGWRSVDFSGVADAVEVAPELLYDQGAEAHVSWLRSVLDRLEPDLVQAHYLLRWPYVATLAGHRPLIVTPWGWELYDAAGSDRRRADHALRHADVVITRSPHMRRELLRRGVPEERIEPADLGVDLEHFSPAREPVDGGPPVILSFRGTPPTTELYNLDVVLDAFRLVRRRLPNATLVLLHGGAPLTEQAQVRLDELADSGVVHITEHVPHAEMVDHMRAATIGVSVPSSDGSPRSVWEAFATGLPLVLSNLPQVEERAGRSGAVFVEPRAETIAAALVDVLEDPERLEQMASRARAWAESNVDERRERARLSEIYARAIRGRDGQSASSRLACPPSYPN